MLRASGGEKIWFLCYYAINMARYNWQTGNSDVRETRNSVINASEMCAKELWHDDCIFPKRKMAETAFHSLLHTEWCTKRCFCVLTEWSECGNNVYGWFQIVLVNGNNVVVVSAICLGRRRQCFHIIHFQIFIKLWVKSQLLAWSAWTMVLTFCSFRTYWLELRPMRQSRVSSAHRLSR